jgi:hypothetical protein
METGKVVIVKGAGKGIGGCIARDYASHDFNVVLADIDHKQHFSGRVGKPDDIARACLYLTDDGNNFINGTNIITDGGMTRKMICEL